MVTNNRGNVATSGFREPETVPDLGSSARSGMSAPRPCPIGSSEPSRSGSGRAPWCQPRRLHHGLHQMPVNRQHMRPVARRKVADAPTGTSRTHSPCGPWPRSHSRRRKLPAAQQILPAPRGAGRRSSGAVSARVGGDGGDGIRLRAAIARPQHQRRTRDGCASRCSVPTQARPPPRQGGVASRPGPKSGRREASCGARGSRGAQPDVRSIDNGPPTPAGSSPGQPVTASSAPGPRRVLPRRNHGCGRRTV